MAYDFPNSPTDGQQFTPPGGQTYTWSTAGTKWTVTGTGLTGLPTASTTDILTGTSTAVVATPDAIAALWEYGGTIASAATLVLTDGGLFYITGAVTITDVDFQTDKQGRAAWVVFSGAPLLTHSATLILPSAANIQTVVGDRALFISEGTDIVRCYVYQRASGTVGTVNVQTFSASGTYTPTSGMVFCVIDCVGGGAGGGGVTTAGPSVYGGCGGGGSGSFSRSRCTAAQIGASKVVTIGAGGSGGPGTGSAGSNGGDTSVGVLCIANGGIGGAGSAGGTVTPSMGGPGGGAGTGDVVASNGNSGGSSSFATNVLIPSGFGAGSVFGGGARGIVAVTATTGSSGANFGAGGAGAFSGNSTGAAAGGAGMQGVVIITEYVS